MSFSPAKTCEPPAPTKDACPEKDDARLFSARMQLLAAGMIIFVGLIYLLREFATVFQHLLVALFLSYAIMPVYQWLVRRRVPGLAAVILIVAAVAAGFAGLGMMVGNSFQDLETKLPQYQNSLEKMLEDATTRFPKLAQSLEAKTESDAGGVQWLRAALHGVSDLLSQTLLVVIYFLFLLAERSVVSVRLERAFGAERGRQIEEVARTINASITQYIVVKTTMGLLAGVLTVAVLLVFGVDYAVLWGILTFLFNYIPYLGSVLATIAPVLLTLVQFQDFGRTLVILAVLLIVQNVIGYLIEPRLAGRKLDLSPLVIIVSLAFWGSLWGIVGMILAVPLVVVIKTILENTAATRPLARMLANA
jgi:AI-2 transport protein TqsA